MENRAGSKLSKTLSIVILLALLGAVAALCYVVAFPQPTEKFTEFYILDPSGNATGYPRQMKTGEETPLILGIINQEQKAVSYRVDIKIDGVIDSELEPIALEHNGKFEQVVNLSLDKPGTEQQVEFLLYKDGETDVYQSLHLWVNVND